MALVGLYLYLVLYVCMCFAFDLRFAFAEAWQAGMACRAGIACMAGRAGMSLCDLLLLRQGRQGKRCDQAGGIAILEPSFSIGSCGRLLFCICGAGRLVFVIRFG